MPVYEPPPHAAFEEAAAAIAGVDAIMFAAAGVTADFADQRWTQSFSWNGTLGCKSDMLTQGRSVSAIQSAIVSCMGLPSAVRTHTVSVWLYWMTTQDNKHLGLKI